MISVYLLLDLRNPYPELALQNICGPPFLIYTYTIIYIYTYTYTLYIIYSYPHLMTPSAAVPMPPCAGLTTQGRKY